MLVIIVGNTCTGKTSLRMKLQERGYFTVEASDYYQISQKKKKDNLYEKPIPPDQITAYEISEKYGEKLNHAVISGIRTIGEYNFFRNMGVPVHLVAIISKTELCYKRALFRNREYVGTYENFYKNRINKDCQLGLNQLILKADMIINNNWISLEEFVEFGSTLLAPYVDLE